MNTSPKQCPDCEYTVDWRVRKCPRCHHKYPSPYKSIWSGCIVAIVVLISVPGGIFLLLWLDWVPNVPTLPNDQDYNSRTQTSDEEWYEGGTLHNKSALEWQAASKANKLATCADFVTTMWQNGNLKPPIANNISTVDDVRPHAQQLVDFLDAAFKPNPNPEQNRKLFANQTVSGIAAIGMVTMGWTK